MLREQTDTKPATEIAAINANLWWARSETDVRIVPAAARTFPKAYIMIQGNGTDSATFIAASDGGPIQQYLAALSGYMSAITFDAFNDEELEDPFGPIVVTAYTLGTDSSGNPGDPGGSNNVQLQLSANLVAGSYFLQLATEDASEVEPYVLQGYSVVTERDGQTMTFAQPFVQVPGDSDVWTAGKVPSSLSFTASGVAGAFYGRGNWLLATNGNGIYTAQSVHQLI